MTQQNSLHKKIITLTIATILPLSSLLFATKTYGTIPEKALISNIIGKRELWVRHGSQPVPAQIGSILQRYQDALLVNGNNVTRTLLKFLSKNNQDLNLFVQTDPNTNSAIYYFPCTFKGGSTHFGWGLANQQERGCEQGIQLQRGNGSSAEINSNNPLVAQYLKQTKLAQSSPRQIYYCSVTDANGNSWIGTKTAGDPCQNLLQQCQQNSNNCNPTSVGNWWTNKPQLTANIECADQHNFQAEGSGNEMKNLITNIWQEAQNQDAKNCSIQVYSSEDIIVVPASDQEVLATGDQEILVSSRDTGTSLEVSVLKGAIKVRSEHNPEAILLKPGDRYTNFGNSDQREQFNREEALQSTDVQILEAEREGLKFCEQEQVSGGQIGDQRTIQLTANQGYLGLEYDMYGIADKLQIMYEGKELLNTDFVSGSNKVIIPFEGKSSRVEVIVTGNPDLSSTEWRYRLSCPQPEKPKPGFTPSDLWDLIPPEPPRRPERHEEDYPRGNYPN